MILLSVTAFGQTSDVDFQLRIPTHIQVQGNPDSKDNRIGLAAWTVLPDVTAEKNHIAVLLVSGLLWQHKQNWLELMGGTRVNQNGYVDPLINVRFLNSGVSHVNISGDVMMFFREERRRFLWWLAIDTPIKVWKLRAGMETENTHFWNKSDLWGAGPRVVAPIPIELPPSIKISVVTAYHFHNTRNFVRVYAVTNLKFR